MLNVKNLESFKGLLNELDSRGIDSQKFKQVRANAIAQYIQSLSAFVGNTSPLLKSVAFNVKMGDSFGLNRLLNEDMKVCLYLDSYEVVQYLHELVKYDGDTWEACSYFGTMYYTFNMREREFLEYHDSDILEHVDISVVGSETFDKIRIEYDRFLLDLYSAENVALDALDTTLDTLSVELENFLK